MIKPSSDAPGDDVLRTTRMDAALKSKGVSSDAIYDAVKNIIKCADLSGTVLDFGAGTGSFIKWLRSDERFNEVHGADIFARPVELPSAVTWLEVDLNCGLPVKNEVYDLVVAAEVIEHLENPRFICREIFRVMRPGGTAIITTPNNEHLRSLLSLVSRGHFAAFTGTNYPAHITALLRSDLIRILSEAGFDSPTFGYCSSGNVPLTPVTWREISLGALRGKFFCDNIIATVNKPSRYP